MSNQDAKSLILSSYNTTVSGSNNVYNLYLPIPYIAKNEEICLNSLLIYYSWRNVLNSPYANNTMSYIFNGSTFNFTLQDGWYDYEAMNTALQLEMYQNGHYLVDNNGLNIFFLSLATNVTYYACSITATIIPTILPAGWTNPNSISLSGTCPQLVVNNAAWGLLTGFSVGTYPAINTATAQVNSNLIPKINPISSINVCCNMVSNSAFNSYNDVIYTFNY